jgi:hypothetical protein
MIPVFPISINKGCLEFEDMKKYQEYIFSLPDGEYLLFIKKPHEVKSRLEENYMWGCIIPLWADHQGYTRDEAYINLLEECGFGRDNGQLITTSDPRITKKEYHGWIERSRDFMALHGCVSPDPNEAIDMIRGE